MPVLGVVSPSIKQQFLNYHANTFSVFFNLAIFFQSCDFADLNLNIYIFELTANGRCFDLYYTTLA